MKKLNLICAAVATLFAAGAANAGTAQATAATIATDAVGTATTAATQVAVPAMTYNMGSSTAVNASTTVYFTIRLTAGKWNIADGSATNTQFRFGGLQPGAAASSAGVAVPGILVTKSTDLSTLLVAIQSVTAGPTTLGLGAFSYTPAATDVVGINSTLNTVGGTVGVSIGLTSVLPTAFQATDTQGSIDGALGTATLMTAARGVTTSAGAPSSSVKIDLTATTPGSSYTTGANGRAPLAVYRFTTIASRTRLDGTAWAITGNTPTNVTLTPGTSQTFPVGAVLSAYNDALCTTRDTNATQTTVTTANAGNPQVVTTTTAAVTATDYFICMTAPSTGNLATPITPTISATVTSGTATDSILAATGTGYALAYNGSTVDIQTYWPGALDPFTYKGYLRMTNTGAVSAAVTAQHYTTAGVLNSAQPAATITTLAAGQSTMLSTKAIDAIIGAAPSGLESGRIRLTAPTNGLRVQSLMQVGSNAPTEYLNVNSCTTSGTGGTIAANSGGAATFANSGLSALTAGANAANGLQTGGIATFALPVLSAFTTVGGGGGSIGAVSTTCTPTN